MSGATDRANDFEKPSTPPLTAANSSGLSPSIPSIVAWSHPMLRIEPPGRIRLATSREQRIVDLRSTSTSTSSLRSSGHDLASPVSTSAPALLTQTSMCSSSANACCTIDAQPSAVPRSAFRSGCSRSPSSAASARAASVERQNPIPTLAPAAANAIAIALPIPELAPVTTVRRPASGSSPVCAAKSLALGAAGERVTRVRRVREDLVDARLTAQGAGDRGLHGLVVPVVDLLVVLGLPMDEDADDDAQIVDLVLGDDAVGDRVHHGTGDRSLSGTEQLHGLPCPPDRHLVAE